MTDKPTIVEALTACMADVQAIKKGDRNTQQNYSFRGIDAVMNAVGPVFRKHGIVAVPCHTDSTYRDVQTSTGKPSRECTVTVTYRFYGPAGDFIEAQVPGESMDFGDKGAAKAMAVAYRILLLQALCVPTDDPEPDAQSYERAVPAAREPVSPLVAVKRAIWQVQQKLIPDCDATKAEYDFMTRMGKEHSLAGSTDDDLDLLRTYLNDIQDDLREKGAAEAGEMVPA